MTLSRAIILSAAAAIAATAVAAVSVQAQRGDLITFPADYEKGVLYATVDSAKNKQVRRLYVNNKAALDAAKKGQPLPQGTVLTMAQYAAQLDGDGNPVKGPDGRFINTGKIVGYTVMEKRPGWGKDVPEAIRNGDWQYQAFLADRTPNTKAKLAACFECHKPLGEKVDFVYTWEQLQKAM